MVDIIKMTEEHMPRIMQIEQASFSVPWTEGAFLTELYSGFAEMYTALADGDIVGYCVMFLTSPEAEIHNIAVDKTARRLGIGRALMTRALEDAEKQGIERVFLEVRESNIPAQELYRSCGFESVGMRKNYYYDPTENAVIMQRNVGNAEEEI